MIVALTFCICWIGYLNPRYSTRFQESPIGGLGRTPTCASLLSQGQAIMDLDIEELIARYGTPLYLYNADIVRERARALKSP